MKDYDQKFNTDKIYFKETSFNKLMQKRVTDILLVCSKYDKFVLEEDGRIDEQIFQEYVSLNLRYPPRFTQVSTDKEAFKTLERKYYDLVIIMLSMSGSNCFDLAKEIKEEYPNKPVVVLTHFSRELSLKLLNEDLSNIDYIFSWLGDANILLAIVKLLEDKLNVEHDVKKVGVPTIIVVEDNIRYYSSYLPNIYKVLFQQTRKLMLEGLNEHQQTMRMRGRPKILLANNFEEAMELYEKFKNNLLGVITDITYEREGEMDKLAGLKLCMNIRNENKLLPILVQSSQIEHEKDAKIFNAGFLYKHSKNLVPDLKKYIKENFGFGDFVFKNPNTGEEIARAKNLVDLQKILKTISNESILFHAQRNHFSRWMKARVLYTLAKMIKKYHTTDFESSESLRNFLHDVIKNYRIFKGRGAIASFKNDLYDEYTGFTRIGEGSLGGKARGLAFIDSFLKRNKLIYKYENIIINIPKTVVLTTDIFTEFMDENNLYDIALKDIPDEEILDRFLEATLPEQIHGDLKTFLKVIKQPLAVRSSSLLEDSHYQPFAGVYATYMIPNNNPDKDQRFEDLTNAIKAVYASTFYKTSKDYMTATQNIIDEEKMGVVIQEVAGKAYGSDEVGHRFYPTFSGVARSLNFYPIENEKSEDGVVNIALGLGRTIVDGGVSLRFSPKYPKKIIQLSNPSTTLKSTQNKFFALDLDKQKFTPTIDEACSLLSLDVKDAEKDLSIKKICSTYDFRNGIIRDGFNYDGRKIITFAGILKYKMFPLANILADLLKVGSREMNTPVEIEFATNLDVATGDNVYFKFLQIRPIVEGLELGDIDIDNYEDDETIIKSNTSLGNGVYNDLYDFVYVKPESFNPAKTKEIAVKIGELNDKMKKEDKNYILVGPGRWGSSDPWLGIPVTWSSITNASVICEASLKGFRIDPSQGSHFFQNITSFRISYLTINPSIDDGLYDLDFLTKQEVISENEYIRHIRFKEEIVVKVCGKSGKAVIIKPGIKEK